MWLWTFGLSRKNITYIFDVSRHVAADGSTWRNRDAHGEGQICVTPEDVSVETDVGAETVAVDSETAAPVATGLKLVMLAAAAVFLPKPQPSMFPSGSILNTRKSSPACPLTPAATYPPSAVCR